MIMNGHRKDGPKKPSSPLVKIKYETSLLNRITDKSELAQRFSAKSNGQATITKIGCNPSSRKAIHKVEIDSDRVQQLFDQISTILFSDDCVCDLPVDDMGRKISLYYEDGSSLKFHGLYSLGSTNTSDVFIDFIQSINR